MYPDRAMRKRVFRHMRTEKTQISLRIYAIWPGPTLSATRIIGYYWKYVWSIKAQMILCACAGWSESLHFAHVRRHFFAWRAPSDSCIVIPYLSWFHRTLFHALVYNIYTCVLQTNTSAQDKCCLGQYSEKKNKKFYLMRWDKSEIFFKICFWILSDLQWY